MAYQDPPEDDGGQGVVVSGKVKWFRADKGYGFITPDDNSGDIFLHVSVLKRRNIQDVPQGSTVSCEVVAGQKGRQVSRLIDLDTSTATATPPRRPREGGFDRDSRPRSDAPPRFSDRGPGRWQGGGGSEGPPRFGGDDRPTIGGDDRPRRDHRPGDRPGGFRDDEKR